MQLYCPDRLDDIHLTDVICIFEANCFNIGESAAMFLTATRFNHSCLPNTYYSWSEKRGEIVFHAMIDIPEDEEMTICYGLIGGIKRTVSGDFKNTDGEKDSGGRPRSYSEAKGKSPSIVFVLKTPFSLSEVQYSSYRRNPVANYVLSNQRPSNGATRTGIVSIRGLAKLFSRSETGYLST